MKQINEQVSRIRKMMGLNENVNEFFSMPGEREGLPEPVDELFGFSKKEKESKELSNKIEKAKSEVSRFKFNTLETQPGDGEMPNTPILGYDYGSLKKLITYRLRDAQIAMPTVAELLPKLFQPQGGQTVISDKYPDVKTVIPNEWTFTLDNYRVSQEKGLLKLNTMLDNLKGVQKEEFTGKQKDLAALAEPKDKITGADFAALRHGAKLEEEGDNNKYAKLEAAIEKYGSRGVAVKLVDAVLSKMTGMFTASDLPDTATYANGLDTIEELLDVQDYKAAYDAAKETASDMLDEEGYSDFLGEKELSSKQKNIATQAPPYDKITGADFKALQAKKGLDEEMDNTIDPTYTHFAVTSDNKIVTGWEYKDLDTDSIKYYAKGDLKDMEIDPKTVKIYTTKTLMRMGVDPFKPDNWKDIHNTMNEINPTDMFSFGDDEQDPSGGRLPNYNRKLIKSYVDAIEKRARVKKMGVTPSDLMQRFNDMDDMPSRPDIEMLMYTLSQKGLLFSDPSYKNKIQPNEVNQYLEFNDPKQHTDTEKLAMQALDRNMNETVTLTKENMFNALSEAKKKGKVNPWAVCTASVGRDDKDKYERCVMGVKKDKGIKK